MVDENHRNNSTQLGRLMAVGMSLPWLETLAELWKVGRKVWGSLADEGIYEVLEYESTLELQDTRGEHALVRKRQKVRYRQNNIIAYQDQAWGDGEILINYRCTPGIPVDRYTPGQKTYILISLREVKKKDDVDVFNIEWGIKRGFVRETELWETEISHRTKNLKVNVLFPAKRPPQRILLIEGVRQRSRLLEKDTVTCLPDGRWCVSWEIVRPRLYERYQLKWDW